MLRNSITVLFLSIFLSAFAFSQDMEMNVTGEKGEQIQEMTQVTARQIVKATQKSLEKAALSEGFEDGAIPLTWKVINADGGARVWEAYNSTTYSHTGTYSARIRYESSSLDNDDWLITPGLVVQTGIADTLKFWARTYSNSYSDRFKVRLSTTGTDTSDFTTVLFDTAGNMGDYMELVFPLDAYDDDTVFVAIQYLGQYDWYVYADDFEGPEVYIPPIPDFTTPFSEIDLNVDNSLVPAGNSADEYVYITNAGGGDLIISQVNTSSEVISTNFVPGDLTIAPGETDSILVTWTPIAALMDTGWVEFVHNADSNPDTVSLTLHSVVAGSWVIDFETDPDTWVQPTGYGFEVYGRYGSTTLNEHWGEQGNWWSSSWGDTSYLTTPRLDLSRGPTEMSFWHKGTSTGDDTVRVYAGPAPGKIDSWVEIGKLTNTGSDWKYETFDLSTWAGSDSVWVKWTYEYPSGGTSGSSWYMDDLALPERYLSPDGVLYASASNLDFGTVSVGDTMMMEVGLTNAGGAVINVNSVISDNSVFIVESDITTIASFATETFMIKFAPDAAGIVSANIAVDHDGVNGEAVLNITATGNGLAPFTLPFMDEFETSASLDNYVVSMSKPDVYVTISDGYSSVDPFAGDSVLQITGGAYGDPTDCYVDLMLNLGDITNSVLFEFYLALYSLETGDSFSVDIYDGSWHNDIIAYDGGGTMQWVQHQMTLDAYNMVDGFIIRFHSLTTSNGYDRVFIDNLSVYEFAGADVGVTDVSVNGNLLVGVPVSLNAEIYNFGSDSVSSFDVTYNVDESTMVTETFSDTIPPLMSMPFTFDSMYTPAVAGLVDIVMYTTLLDDGDTSNDTSSAVFNVLEAKTLPYMDDFETSASLLNYAYNSEGGEAVFTIDDGHNTVVPVSGDSMLGFWGAANNVPIVATVDLFIDMSAAINPEISFALGTYSLETSSDTGYVDIYDGTWHKRVVAITGTNDMTQYTFNLDSMGWNKVSDFTIRFAGIMNYPMTSDGVFVDNIMVKDLVTAIDDKINLPKTFALEQNFPNPFNPSTHIKYQVPEQSDVKIQIYNLLGQRIKTLVNKSVEAGYHEVIWDGTNQFGTRVSSGIYIYTMEASDFVKSHKLILMK